MRTARNRPSATHRRRRNLCAAGAATTLLLTLACAPGCDDTIRTDIRQGALTVFESGLDDLYGQLETGVTDWLDVLGPGSSGTADSTGGQGDDTTGQP
jgi:hypothetical protein